MKGDEYKKMNVYISSQKRDVDAKGVFNEETKTLTVIKGSRVSPEVSHSEKFKAANKVEELRKRFVINQIVKEDVCFKSASTAANFVNGFSSNGLTSWRDEKGIVLRDYVKK